ncbi:UDP-N-acetylenolpyruvoylglucosamine reductase [Candidatus Gottesmanbacteria bacterium RIFCSPLOWO2_02_FULL_40_10]|nr:MAG: UDP-N-acetylenolpyruvoylglucosamine reductase [Candidatus Gottesmanbacteria bacterium RIFCSPLOWO2_02_FULL_40_10]
MDKFPLMVKKSVSLAGLSTFSIGGKVDNLVEIKNRNGLLTSLSYFKKNKISFKVFAEGSNIVFPDKGINGFLIRLINGSVYKIGNEIVSDAGVTLTKLINFSIKNGLSGLEKLSGIPGSVGGAVVGNAGAYGISVSDIIQEVECWDNGKIYWLTNADSRFRYRDSIFKHKPFVIVSVRFRLKKSSYDSLRKTSLEIISIREKKYKPGLKCPGSFFKNIIVADLKKTVIERIGFENIKYGKIPAGFLLEKVGACGMSVGDIEIASFHGNLFYNKGKGKSEEVKKLAGILKAKVYKKFGTFLEEEIRYFL